MTAPASRVEELLRHEGYVRALARRLVFDEDLSRDVAQETWLAALQHGPRDGAVTRAWLGRVVRNLAYRAFRGRGRRDERERAAPLRDVPTDPATLLEREDARRAVVEALASLDEPWRGTLILRHFDELAPAEIARRTGVPLKTVYARLERGVELLRAKLERRGGRAWSLALVHGLKLSPTGHGALALAATKSLLQGACVMGALHKALLGGAALVAVAAALFSWERSHAELPAVPALERGHDARALERPPEDAPKPEDQARRASVAAEPSGSGSAASAPPPATGSLLVRVLWGQDKTPAADVGVTLHFSKAEDFYQDALRLSTGAEGTVLVEPALTGRVSIYLDRGGVGGARVEAGARTETTLEIEPGFDVVGTVRDFDGRALAGADVYVYACMGDSYEGAVLAHTSADGSFRVRSVREKGLCFLSARARGRAPTPQVLVLSAAGEQVKVDLVFTEAGGSVEGRVLAPDGSVCPGAAVVVERGDPNRYLRLPDGSEGRAPASQRVFADAEGRYRFEGVAAGECTLEARAKGFAPWEGRVEVVAGRTANFDVTLSGGVRVEGSVRDADGAPLSGVEIQAGGGYGFAASHRRSASDGSFAFDALAPGEIEIAAESEERGSARAVLRGAAGETLRWDAVLARGLVLQARVVAPGRALEGWWFQISSEGGAPPFLQMAHSGADGRFEVPACPDAPLRIEGHAPGEGSWPIVVVEHARAGTGELVIEPDPALEPSIRIQGRVVDAEGRPLVGVQVVPGRAGFATSPILYSEPETGTFDFGPFPPGEWRLHFAQRGFAARRLPPRTLAAGENWEIGDVVLQRGGQVVVRVRRPAEADAQSSWFSLTSATNEHRTLRLEGDTARSDVVEPGRYRLCAGGSAVALASRAVEVRAGEETVVEWDVERGLPVLVRIADFQGRALGEGVRCEISGEGGALSSTDLLAAFGPLEWRGRLVPGNYRFTAAHADGRRGEVAFELPAGAEPAAPFERTLTIR